MSRTYYEGGFNIIYDGGTGWFTVRDTKYYAGLLYEENGKFYEFMTGECLGEENIKSSANLFVRVHSDEYGDIINAAIHKRTAEDFARKAKEYMPYKGKIVRLVREELAKRRKAYAKELEEQKRKAAEQAARAKEDKENAAWLEQQFKNRRH